MATKGKGKGKQVASDPPRASDASGSGKRRRGTGAAGPSSSSAATKRRRRSGVLQFFDDDACVADEYEEEEEPESEDDLDDGFFTEEKTETANLKRTERSHPLPFLGKVKEEELSGDELEEFVKNRYANRVKYAAYGGSTKEYDDEFTMDGLLKEPTIWRVKCMVGRERQMAFCFMQKFVDLQKFGTKVPIISAFALDHVRGFVFVEAEKACDVTEACKGFCSVNASRVSSVPASEVPSLLSSRAKPFEISPGTWVRMKSGNYKGDLAQVVSADDGRKRVMIKLMPRVDLQAISKKFGGAISLKEAAVPAPRLISSQELEFFRPHIEMRRDRQTGDVFEMLDGLMFKDGFLYKRVALSSLIYWGIQPTETELLKFSSSPSNRSSADDLDWVSSIYGPKKRNLPRERDMKAKASSSKEKCSNSKASNLKASTSTENYDDDDEFKLHDLVLFGRKDFGVVIAVEKDGFKILKGGPEGSAVTIRKQDIKKGCVDKMFTAVDHQKKIISINDTVKVLEGPFQGKHGVVKHLYMGILFIYNESESENNGFFCAQCGSCENIKKRKELASSTAENSENNPIPMFSESPVISYGQNEQGDTERPYRSTREQLFSIGQMLRIRKGPLKGYLCRVVRIFRNDVTVKLDSLLKIFTVQAELLSVPTKRGRSLITLFLEECSITDNATEWLHDLAVNSPVLVTLNFHMTELRVVPADLELLAKNCKSLISLKISDCDLSDLIGFFRMATSLQEFAGGVFNEQGELTKHGNFKFPSRLCSLGLTYMGTNDTPIIFPFSAVLKKLDLQFTFLTTEDHCQLIAKCPNLLVLAARNVIGDRGLRVVADTCKKLQRLRIERGDDDPGLQEEQGGVSQVGLMAVAVGCRELEYIAAYVSDITNGALESIGTFCKNLCDFRLVLLDREERITELPLDNGVRALLRNCTKLRRFALYLRPGGLSDVGLGYIGQYSGTIQYMLLGNVGETDDGLIRFASGCVNLRKLELRSCCFSEQALARAVLHMPSLRYVWVQGYKASQTGRDLMLMARPFWNIEFTPPSPENADRLLEDGEPCVDRQAQVLAYYSLAGKRLDCPQYVVPLYPA